MRDSPPKVPKADGRGVDFGDADYYNETDIHGFTAIAANRKVIGEIRRAEDEGDTLDSQQIDRLKRQFPEVDSQLEEAEKDHSQSKSQRWIGGVENTDLCIDALSQQSQQPFQKNNSEKETTYSQLQPPAGPLVSETQLQGLFEDTQFDKGHSKATEGKGKETQDVRGQGEESQDTQFYDNLKEALLEGETQVVGDSQPETIAEKVGEQEQEGTSGDTEESGGAERELVKGQAQSGRIPSQADDTQFIEGLKAQFLNSVVEESQNDDTSQLEDTSAQDKTVLTEASAESAGAEGVERQGSDQVVLFPIGTSFGEGISYSQSQFPDQNEHHGLVNDSIEQGAAYSEQSRASQVPAYTPVRHPSVEKRQGQSTAARSSLNTITHASFQRKSTDRLFTTPNSKRTTRRPSKEDITRLAGRAMDDWSRDSMGTASQTQPNDSGPRYGAAAKSQEDGSSTKKNRSSETQSSGRDNLDVDRTYNENESGAIRLDLSQSQMSQGDNLAVSQDQGMRSPSYDFARLAKEDGTSQVEPETPARGNKNPFGKSGVPMGMSQVFAATQSSPLDPRFMQSEGLRPSSPGIGLASSPVKRGSTLNQDVPVDGSSPSHVELTVASSFQPFDESTQPEAIKKARTTGDDLRAKYGETYDKYKHFFVGRVDPGELPSQPRRESEPAKKPPVNYDSDDGMDIEQENRRRIAVKRLKDKMEKNLRDVGDMQAPRKQTYPPLDRVRRAASTGRVIKKNDVRAARLRQKESAERSSPAQDKKAEEVEVPASGEASKAKTSTSRKNSRKSRSRSEEYRAQSEGVDARDTQEYVVIRSSQPRRSSQPEVVVDSQANISTQAETTHGSLEEVEDSYQPPNSAPRPESKSNRTSSAMLPDLGSNEAVPSSQAKSSPPGTSVPVTSSAHYLKRGNTTPGASKRSNETAPDVVPETSPPSKTVSPEKPFSQLDEVVDSPMQSFGDIPMTQEPPNQNDITPTKFVERSERGKKLEKKMARGNRVVFTEEPSDGEEEEYLEVETPTKVTPVKAPAKAKRGAKKAAPPPKEKPAKKSPEIVVDEEEEVTEVVTPVKGKKGARKTTMPPKAKPSFKSAEFIVDEDSDDERQPSPTSKNASAGNGRDHTTVMPAARMSAPPPTEDNEDLNANALATVQQLNTDRGKGKGKKANTRKLAAKVLEPAEESSPHSSPIRPPDRRSARHLPSDLQKQSSPPTAPPSEDQPMQVQDSDDDDAPLARPISKRRQDAKINDSSDTEMADASPVKKTSKPQAKPTTLSNSLTLPPLEDDDDEDQSVSPVRESIETAAKPCQRFMMNLACTRDHSTDGLVHDAAFKALSQKRRGSSDVPSTASPGKEASPAATNRDSNSASVFTRPDSADAPHLPPTATCGRVHGETTVAQPQASVYDTAQSSIARRSVESSPLSDIASDLAEELEEFHTANAAGPLRDESRSRSGTEMSDAQLMPPPQTVTRRLDFAAAELPSPTGTPALPETGKVRGKRTADGSGGKGKKARKMTPEATPSRSRQATRSASMSDASDDQDDEDETTLLVKETPRATPTRRQGRKTSRPSYAESPSDDGSNDGGPGPSTIAARTRSSRTPSSEISDHDARGIGGKASDLFKGMAFAISYKHSNLEAVEDREEVTALILSHGGEIIEDFKDLFEKNVTDTIATPSVSRANSTNTSFANGSRRGSAQPNPQPAQNDNDESSGDLKLTEHARTLGFVAFIGDTYSRKSKFLQALSLSLPCLSSFFIRECVRTRSILRWMPYMLAAGEPRKMRGMVCNRDIEGYSAVAARFERSFGGRKRMLTNLGVLALWVRSGRGNKGVDNKVKREHYLWLLRALGAREVRRVGTAGEARRLIGEAQEGRRWDVVYVDDGEKVGMVKREVGMSEEGRGVRVVSDEFVVQSLILGGLEDEDLVDEGWVGAQRGEGDGEEDRDVEMDDEGDE